MTRLVLGTVTVVLYDFGHEGNFVLAFEGGLFILI